MRFIAQQCERTLTVTRFLDRMDFVQDAFFTSQAVTVAPEFHCRPDVDQQTIVIEVLFFTAFDLLQVVKLGGFRGMINSPEIPLPTRAHRYKSDLPAT